MAALLPWMFLAKTSYARDAVVSPEGVVAEVINNNDWGRSNSKMFTCPPSGLMRSRFTKSYVNSWAIMCVENEKSPALDGDVFLGAQGIDDVSLDSISKRKKSKNHALVLAKIGYNEKEVVGKPRRFEQVLFWLKVQGGIWKINGHQIYRAQPLVPGDAPHAARP